jgi:ABC-type glycerol-3-phosphate transport system substrate-binding protein
MLKRLKRTLAVLACVIAGATGAQAEDAPVRTLRVMGFQPTFVQFRDGWAYIIKEFEKQNPGVKIEDIATAFDQTLNQVTASVLGGNAPDVIDVNAIWMAQLLSIGALAPLDQYVPADELKLFPRHVLEDLTFDGHVRGLALNAGPIIMMYNRDLLKEAGLDPNKPPKTWPEFKEAVAKICALPPREGGKTYGVALRTERLPIAAQWTIPIIWANGGDIVDSSGQLTLNTPAAVAAFDWYKDVVGKDCSPANATVADTRNLFAQGRAGFVFEGPWIKGLIDALSGKKMKVAADGNIWGAPMPADSSGRVRELANHSVLAMTAQAKDKELAAKFIRFAVGDRDAVEFSFSASGVISTSRLDLLTSGKQGADPFSQLFVPALDSAIGVPLRNPRWAAAMDPITVALQKVIQGGDSATELGQAEREARRLLNRR